MRATPHHPNSCAPTTRHDLASVRGTRGRIACGERAGISLVGVRALWMCTPPPPCSAWSPSPVASPQWRITLTVGGSTLRSDEVWVGCSPSTSFAGPPPPQAGEDGCGAGGDLGQPLPLTGEVPPVGGGGGSNKHDAYPLSPATPGGVPPSFAVPCRQGAVWAGRSSAGYAAGARRRRRRLGFLGRGVSVQRTSSRTPSEVSAMAVQLSTQSPVLT